MEYFLNEYFLMYFKTPEFATKTVIFCECNTKVTWYESISIQWHQYREWKIAPAILSILAAPLLLGRTMWVWSMTGVVFTVKLSVAPPSQGTLNHQSTGGPPTGRAKALHFHPWMTSDTPSLCLVALKRQWWGFQPSQAAGCNWCGRDVSTNLLLSDGLSVRPSSTRLWVLYQPWQTAT